MGPNVPENVQIEADTLPKEQISPCMTQSHCWQAQIFKKKKLPNLQSQLCQLYTGP